MKPERAVLIRGSGVDLAHFDAAPRAREGPVTFVMACRMLWSKGVREFVEASDQVAAQRSDCRFILVGSADRESREGVSEAWLREAVASRPHLRWLGFVTDIAPILKGADVMVLAQLLWRGESRSRCLEGAAARLPLISTDMPGCREVVLHNRTGLQVSPRDPDGLALAMLQLAESPTLRTAFGQAARKLVEDEFSVQTVVSKTLASYRRSIQGP